MDNFKNLFDKAKDLAENVPGDIKDKAGEAIDTLTEKLPDNIEDTAKGAVDGIKDKLGLNKDENEG
ncbi:hypothetical protein [Lactovum odontotermitis]